MIGVGNALRGDGGSGSPWSSGWPRRVPADVDVVECEQEPTRLVDAFADADGRGRRRRLRVRRAARHRVPLRRERRAAPARVFRSSTHACGVGERLSCARARAPSAADRGLRRRGWAVRSRSGAEPGGRVRRRAGRRRGRSRVEEMVTMHEHALIREVMSRIDEIARAEGATRVTRVQVRLGRLHVAPAHLRALRGCPRHPCRGCDHRCRGRR